MIFDWIDEEKLRLSVVDRMILILYDLAITNKEQIKRITGWSDNRINGALTRIRKMDEKNPDAWLQNWQPFQNQGFVYSLGEKGIEHARALRKEYIHRNQVLKGHAYHFLGINEILIRLLDSQLQVEEWLSSKEAASWLYHILMIREVDEETGRIKMIACKNTPLRPDAIAKVSDHEFFIEFDTGTESSVRLEQKFHKYFDLGTLLNKNEMKTVLFVTVTQKRKDEAERIFNRAVKRYSQKERSNIEWNGILFCVEGEEAEIIEESLRESQ